MVPNPGRIGIISDILWVQNLGNEFGPKMVFLDTLGLAVKQVTEVKLKPLIFNVVLGLGLATFPPLQTERAVR